MIKYQLVCDADHEFEGWFGDSAAFEEQSRSGLLQCPVCGTGDVRRALMAPNLASPKTRAKAGNALPPAPDAAALGSEGAPQAAAVHTGSMPPALPAGGPVAGLPPEAAQKMAALITEMRSVQAKIRSECRDVGDQFAEEARKMHYGEAEAEGIYGRTTHEEREALEDEGIDVLDMPWLPPDH